MIKRLLVLVFVSLILVGLGNCGREDGAEKAQAALAAADREQDEGELFFIDDYAPSGTVPWENVEGGVWVLFNKPVIPLSKLGKPAKKSKIISITPPVKGIYRWYGSRLLSFEPSAHLEPAVEYTVSVTPGLNSLAGIQLSGPNDFSFKTETLKLLSLTPSGDDIPPEQCRALYLTFNYPVDLNTIRRYLRVEAGGREYPFIITRPEEPAGGPADTPGPVSAESPDGDKRVAVLELTRELPWDTDVTVRLLEGARPGPRNYGIPEEQRFKFHTLKPFNLLRAEVYDWLATVEAVLVFNHPVWKEDLLSRLEVDLPGYELSENCELFGSYLYLRNLPVEFESTFRINLRAGLRDIYDQRLEEDKALDLEVGPAGSYVHFRGWGDRLLEAQFQPVVTVEFQNIESGGYTAGSLSHPFQELPGSSLIPYDAGNIPRNTRIFRHLDLSPFLNEEGRGAAYVKWDFMVPAWWSEKPVSQSEELRLQVTDLGFSSHIAHNKVLILASRLSTGAPLVNIQVTLRGSGGGWMKGVTDENGLAFLNLEPGELGRIFKNSEKSLELELRQGKDRLIFKPYNAPSYNWNFHGPFRAEKLKPLTYLCSDRGIYRPGESLSFYGIDLDLRLGKFTPYRGDFTVELKQGWYGNNILAEASGRLTHTGRFWGELTLPEDLEPDEYFLVYTRRDEGPPKHSRRVPVKVAFFRRLNFEVELSLPQTEAYMGESLEARFSGKYLAGGRVIHGGWDYWWARREIDYSPPGDYYRSFSFCVQPEWYYEDLSMDEGALSGDGTAVAVQELGDGQAGRVYSYELTATIEDIDRQAVSGQAVIPVFTSELLIGGKLTAAADQEDSLYFVREQAPFNLKVCAAYPDGRPYKAGELSGKLIRKEWNLVRERGVGGVLDTRWELEEIVEDSFRLALNKKRSGYVLGNRELQTDRIGSYLIEIHGTDDQGREALTRFSFYSTGSGYALWQRDDEQEIDIVPDKKIYAPGDTAQLLIKSPLERGRYILTLEREGIIEERILDLEGSTQLVEVEIKEEHIPVIYVALSGSTGRLAPPPNSPDLPDLGKPRGCFGLQAIPVESGRRRIDLDIRTSRESFRPGSEAEVTVTARFQGKPLAGAEIAFIAADRGVLDLINYHIPDPHSFFYDRYNFPLRVAHYDTRELLLDPITWKVREMPGGDKEGEEMEEDFDIRQDFRATAVFEPALITGEDGTVRFRFKLPDQLTRFRATAVAVKSKLFGLAESEILVQNPINVRSALPRRLRVGDTAEAGVVITSLDDQPRKVTVRAESDLLDIKGPVEKRVTVRPGEAVEVSFRLAAGQKGTASLTFSVVSEILKEKLKNTLEVEQSFVQEAFTIIGQTEDSIQEGLMIPENFLGTPDEGLKLCLDSTLASSFTGAIQFLDSFPYDCLEQRTSKLLSFVLYEFLLDSLDEPKDRAFVEEELSSLAGYRTAEGGFSYWQDPGFRRPDYYVTLRTAHLLLLARERGFKVPEELSLAPILEYIRKNYPDRNLYQKSYALYLLALSGEDIGAEADLLLQQEDRLGFFGYAFLGLAYHELGDKVQAEGILSRLKNFIRVGARSVTLINPADSWSYVGGNVQAKALLLMLYKRIDPRSQIVQALADDLLASSRNGYWLNTSSTGWVLQAFAEYLDGEGEREADFTALVTLGETVLYSRRFKGLSAEPYRQRVDTKELLEIAGKNRGREEWLPLTISKQGRGRLYYAATLSYALDPARAEARDEGIGLFTEILDEQGRAAGSRLKLGRAYRMRIVLYSSRDRDYLALRVPIPSGAEVVDGSLVTSPVIREEEEDYWFQPVKRVYDNEVRFFYDYAPRGKRELSFWFRTTTPGRFPTPPATAELMYEEEVFGRTEGQDYRIVP